MLDEQEQRDRQRDARGPYEGDNEQSGPSEVRGPAHWRRRGRPEIANWTGGFPRVAGRGDPLGAASKGSFQRLIGHCGGVEVDIEMGRP